MKAAGHGAHVLAIDLPGTGESGGAAADGSSQQVAAIIRRVAETLGLDNLTPTGHDAGALVVYAYLRARDLHRAVLMDAPVPGVGPRGEQMLQGRYKRGPPR